MILRLFPGTFPDVEDSLSLPSCQCGQSIIDAILLLGTPLLDHLFLLLRIRRGLTRLIWEVNVALPGSFVGEAKREAGRAPRFLRQPWMGPLSATWKTCVPANVFVKRLNGTRQPCVCCGIICIGSR